MADSKPEDKKDSLFLYSNGLTYDSPSFSNLLKSVLSSKSPPFPFQGQHETSQKGIEGVIKPKVTRVQMKFQIDFANPLTNSISTTPSKENPEIAMMNPPMLLQKDMPCVKSPLETSNHSKCEGHNGNKPESEKLFIDSEVQQKHDLEPRFRKRVKESKTVVHTSADMAITSDGYRWRKYGQKTVKGNSQSSSNIRSYYRCTFAGCSARKHVERVPNDATTAIISYVGKHDHGIPVPKKHKVSIFPKC